MKLRNKFSALLVAVAITFAAFSSQAQALKFGHINSADLLQAMPEIKAADSSLAAYQKTLEDQNQTMLTDYQQKLDDYQKNQGTMTDAVKEVKQQELTDLQNRIQQFQQSAQDKFADKKQEIYGPILKKAQDAIKDIAKQNNYAYVFDTSAGAVIYAQPTDDLMDMVKKKLGLK